MGERTSGQRRRASSGRSGSSDPSKSGGPSGPSGSSRPSGPSGPTGPSGSSGPRRLSVALALAALSLAACKSCEEPQPAAPEAGSAQVASGGAGAGDSGPVEAPDGVAVSDAPDAPDASEPSEAGAAMADGEHRGDAGAPTCRLVYGPAEQSFRGPAALSVVGKELRLILNDSGKPRVSVVPITPVAKGAPPIVPPRPRSFTGVRWPACEVAGRFVYCQGPGGSIVRSVLGPDGRVVGEGKVVAQSRSGTRIAAASFGRDHSVVAFLDMRRTTEGDMLQAFVALDDRDPVRLSDDGAGATTLRFLQRGDEAVAVYLDTRTAMVPVHARPVSFDGSKLSLGEDVVIFVGGPPERGIDLTVAPAGPKAFALIPMPHESMDFGMATLPIEDPPKDAVSAIWSFYPNGLDPAPIAAAPAHDGKSAFVARVRPRHKEPGSPRIMELGRIDASGAFTSLGEIADGKRVTDIAMIDDGAGVWILYGDPTITWLERRVCTGS